MAGSDSEHNVHAKQLAPEDLLSKYEQLLERSRQMLELAKLNQWEELLSEEARYVEDVQRLSSLTSSRELESNELQQRLDLMEKILQCNLEVKQRLESRRDEIGELISHSKRQGELGRSYGVIDSIDKP